MWAMPQRCSYTKPADNETVPEVARRSFALSARHFFQQAGGTLIITRLKPRGNERFQRSDSESVKPSD